MSAFNLAYPAFMLALGLLMLINPRLLRDAKEREYQKRLAARRERGTDEYFEELRELEAYPPPRTEWLGRVLGLLLVLLGAFVLIDTASGR